MKKEIYALISTDGGHEYDIHVYESIHGTRSYQLLRSSNNLWADPGEHILTITNIDDEIHFSPKIKKKITFANLLELNLLSDFILNHDNNTCEYIIYKKVN